MTPYLKGDTLKKKTSFLVSMLDFGGGTNHSGNKSISQYIPAGECRKIIDSNVPAGRKSVSQEDNNSPGKIHGNR